VADLFAWFAANPSAFASLTSAVIAASVALFVFAITQFVTHKRARTQFLAPKLEELYLLLNELSEQNAEQSKVLYLCAALDEEAKKQLYAMNDLDLYGLRRAKKIVMYIRLYFPRLSRIHQHLFAAEREFNNLKFEMFSEAAPTLEELIDAGGWVAHFLRLMEQEIIKNRDYLLWDKFFPKRYSETTAKEMEEMVGPPPGPMWADKRSGSAE
jgi:hypothetical protein